MNLAGSHPIRHCWNVVCSLRGAALPQVVSLNLALLLLGCTVITFPSLAQQGGSDQARPEKLVEAAGKGDIATIRRLLSGGADPNVVDNSSVKGWTPLMSAAKAGSTDAVEALLKASANVNATNAYGGTALDVAAVSHGFSSRVADLIYSAGGKGSERDKVAAAHAARGQSTVAPATASRAQERATTVGSAQRPPTTDPPSVKDSGNRTNADAEAEQTRQLRLTEAHRAQLLSGLERYQEAVDIITKLVSSSVPPPPVPPQHDLRKRLGNVSPDPVPPFLPRGAPPADASSQTFLLELERYDRGCLDLQRQRYEEFAKKRGTHKLTARGKFEYESGRYQDAIRDQNEYLNGEQAITDRFCIKFYCETTIYPAKQVPPRAPPFYAIGEDMGELGLALSYSERARTKFALEDYPAAQRDNELAEQILARITASVQPSHYTKTLLSLAATISELVTKDRVIMYLLKGQQGAGCALFAKQVSDLSAKAENAAGAYSPALYVVQEICSAPTP